MRHLFFSCLWALILVSETLELIQEYHVIPVFQLLLDNVSASEARVHLCSFRAIV